MWREEDDINASVRTEGLDVDEAGILCKDLVPWRGILKELIWMKQVSCLCILCLGRGSCSCFQSTDHNRLHVPKTKHKKNNIESR